MYPLPSRRHSSRGFVLIVVLAILAILALLGITFVTLSSVERDVSRTYLDDTRARFAASSGIEYGLVRIREVTESANGPMLVTPVTRSLIYYGNQMDETQSPDLTTPLRNAKNPSLAVEANGADMADTPAAMAAYDPTPKIIRVNGTDVGYSGAFESGTYGKDCDTYSLRITDANGKIYVNDGLDNPGVTANLKRILNNLGALSTVGVSGLGTLLINSRPPKGYQSYYDLRKLFSNQADYDRVRNFITIYAWVDTKVVNPVPLSPDASVLSDYPVQYRRPIASLTPKPPSYPTGWTGEMYRYGRQANYRDQANTTALTWGSNIYGWDELNPQYIEVTSRAPVNVNIAPREVLIALLQDLQGFFVMETPRDPVNSGYSFYGSSHSWDDATPGPSLWVGSLPSMIGTVYKTLKVGSGGPSPTTIADKIIANRNKRLGTGDITQSYHGPFTSWAQFSLFVDSLVADGTIVDTRFTGLQQKFASQAMADAIKANFNPNLHLNEINPDENLHTLVDKTDLLVNSTEFCFTYRGIFEIQSVGRILKPLSSGSVLVPQYNLVAEKTVECVVKLYDVYREGTQSDFYRGEFTIDGPGGTTLTSAYAHTNYRTNNNRSLETGPEPDNGLAPSENEYEGYLRLATIGGPLPVGPGSSSPVAGQVHKPKGDVWETPRGAAAFGENIHGHFAFDYDLHYAVAAQAPPNDIRRLALTRNWNRGGSIPGINQTYYNYADWSEKGSRTFLQPQQVQTGTTINAAYQLSSDNHREGQTFTAAAPIVSAGVCAPSWSNNIGTLVVTLYTSPAKTTQIATQTFVNYTDNAWLDLSFPQQPAGTYYLEWYTNNFSQQVGAWGFTTNVYAGGTAYSYILPAAPAATGYDFAVRWTTMAAMIETNVMVGPYSLSDSPGITPWSVSAAPREYRIARSFRLPPAVGEIVPALTGAFYAPSDLRADGGYIERHASAVYWPGSSTSYASTNNSNINTTSGAASFWVKPAFYPELAGKFRTFFSQSKMWYKSGSTPWGQLYDAATTIAWPRQVPGFNPMNMGLHFMPNNTSGLDNSGFVLLVPGWGWDAGQHMVAQRSFGYGFSYSWWTGLTSGFAQGGWQTSTVNHVGHATDDNIIYNKFKAHRWTLVTLRWNAALPYGMRVNAVDWGNKQIWASGSPPTSMSATEQAEWNRAGTDTVWNSINPIRLGEPSILVPPTSAVTPGGLNVNLQCRTRNFSADSTIDEFYIWNDYATGETAASQNQWQVGRYYRHNDGRFTSGDIALNVGQDRTLPPPSLTEVIPPSEIPPRKVRLIGISWTQYAEAYALGTTADPLQYKLYDYQTWTTNPTGSPTSLPAPRFEFKVSGDGSASWSPIVADSRWNKLDVSVSDPTRVKYTVKFVTNASDLNSILLSTPVLDDVLLYYQAGGAAFLEYTAL